MCDVVMVTSGTMEEPDTLKILNKGTDYFRQRVLQKNPEVKKQHRKSAVELLDESKSLYVKSESVRHSKQLPKRAENLQVGARRDKNWRASDCVELLRQSTPPAVPPRQGKSAPRGRQRRATSLTEPPTCWLGKHTAPAGQDRSPGLSHRPASNGCSLGESSAPPLPPRRQNGPQQTSMEYVAKHADTHREPCQPTECAASSPARRRCGLIFSSDGDGQKDSSTEPLSKPMPTILAGDEWRETRTDTSSEIDGRSNNSSLVKDEHALAAVRRRVKKAIHRSRSDLAKRYSNSSDLSELSARYSRNSADLEKFFNEMGLDKSVLEPMLNAQCNLSTSDLHLLESCSSVDSPDDRSICSDVEDFLMPDSRLKSDVVEERAPTQTSIVERNARIIKWLCSVKKAHSTEEDAE